MPWGHKLLAEMEEQLKASQPVKQNAIDFHPANAQHGPAVSSLTSRDVQARFQNCS